MMMEWWTEWQTGVTLYALAILWPGPKNPEFWKKRRYQSHPRSLIYILLLWWLEGHLGQASHSQLRKLKNKNKKNKGYLNCAWSNNNTVDLYISLQISITVAEFTNKGYLVNTTHYPCSLYIQLLQTPHDVVRQLSACDYSRNLI